MDLSLTRILCGVYEAGSVTRAASALNLTQSAVSHALARLRREVQDQLFVRTAAGMVPTPRAAELYAKFREAIRLVEQAIEDTRVFNAQASSRRFRLAMSDIGVLVFLPPILRHLQRVSPAVAIDVRQIAVPDLRRALEIGEIDLALGNIPGLHAEAHHSPLFEEHYVCVLKADHSAIRNSLSLKAFLAARHVAVVSNLSGHTMVEEALLRHGLKRQVVLETPHFTSVPEIIGQTDLIVTAPSRVAAIFAATHGLRSLPLPVVIPPFTVRSHWHERSHSDQGHLWMRGIVSELLTKL